MVLESLINPLEAEKKPSVMILLGFVYSTVSLFLSYWIFQKYSSLVMVFLTVLTCAPLMYKTIKTEEKFDLEIDDEKSLLMQHAKALHFLLYLFLGITISFTLWYLVLPSDMAQTAYSVQSETIGAMNSGATGQAINNMSIFSHIFFNNIKVMIFCILFSLTFGLGAIFILVWNASVIGVAFGNFIRTKISTYSSELGFAKLGGYLHVTSWGFVRYAIHGVPEILAYFVAGLAGGIMSIAIARHHFSSKRMEKILLDVSDLIIIAVVLLVFAGLIEAFITPSLY